MDWNRVSDYHSVSDSPRGYTICVTGPKDGRVYTAWGPGEWHGRKYQPLGYFTDGTDKEKVAAAKQACVKHYMGTRKDGGSGRAA